MSSLLKKAMTFAKSPQGQRALAQVKKSARDPKNKQKIEQLRKNLFKK